MAISSSSRSFCPTSTLSAALPSNLAAAGIHGPWFLALDHSGIIAELNVPTAAMPGPDKSRYAFDTLGELYTVLNRVYALGVGLPDGPLLEFELRVADIPGRPKPNDWSCRGLGRAFFAIA
jgi:hypothetical protein